MLHAASLRFPHPDGKSMRIDAPVPDDMLKLCAAVGLI
jgi:hypothetical protein